MTSFLRFRTEAAGDITLGYQGSWPPPERLVFAVAGENGPPVREPRDGEESVTLHCVACSELTDEVMQDAPHLARGALYVYEPDEWDGRT